MAQHSGLQPEIEPSGAWFCSHNLSTWLIGVLAVVGVLALFLPVVPVAPTGGRRSYCKNNLKMIGLALHSYKDDYGCLPPAYIADGDGRPMHSWRVLLLPYLDHSPLYRQYRFDEPWDGPNNSKLAESIVKVYRCLSDEAGADSPEERMTSYVAIVGPETAWPGQSSIRISDIKDESANTLLVVEVANSGIHWMEPRDLEFSRMASTINSKTAKGISSRHSGGAWALSADGSVRFLTDSLPAATVRALLTIRGGEKVSTDDRSD